MIQHKNMLLVALQLLPFVACCQIGPLNAIDLSTDSAGVTEFQSADMDNDGDMELIVSFTGTNGKIGYYDNLSNGNFSSLTTMDGLSFARGVATINANADGATDIVAIGGINAEIKVYINNSGTFDEGIIDTLTPTTLNGVVVADFDADGTDDFVVIGQHSIDFYRNDGIGTFSKEIILDTDMAVPRVLECLNIATADIDGDGDMDVLTAETEGLVIYVNDGSAIFTPNYYSIIPEIGQLLHPMDMDNDGDLDILLTTSTEGLKWFSNDGTGAMTDESTIPNVPNIKSMTSIDYNMDGLLDLYVSYPFNISIFLNDESHEFGTEINIHQNNAFPMGPVFLADMDQQGALDFVWSGGTNTVAYQANQTPLSVTEIEDNDSFRFFPNPTEGSMTITSSVAITDIELFNLQGNKIDSMLEEDKIDIQHLSSGIYLLKIKTKNGVATKKIIKH